MSKRDPPINRFGSKVFVQIFPHSPCCIEGRNIERALPFVGQLDRRLGLSPQRLRGDKALEIKRLCARAQVIHGAAQLVGEYGQRFGFAVLVLKGGEIFFSGLTLADKEDCRFRKRPT